MSRAYCVVAIFVALVVFGVVTDVFGEPWFVVGTPVLCSDFLPGEAGWDGGRFGIAQYFSHSDDIYPFHIIYERGARRDFIGSGTIVDFSPAAYRYVKKLDMVDLTSEQRRVYEAWQAEACGPSASPREE